VEQHRVKAMLSSSSTVSKNISAIQDYSRGDRIKAKLKGWSKHYSGEITNVRHDGTYDIKFDDGEKGSSVDSSQIQPVGTKTSKKTPTIKRPMLSPRSQVFSPMDRVEAQLTGWTKYYGGMITADNGDGTYDIKFDDGERKRSVLCTKIRPEKKNTYSPRKDSEEEDNSNSSTFVVGERVEAKLKGWNKHYSGRITKAYGRDETYDITFDDGEKGVDVDEHLIRRVEKDEDSSIGGSGGSAASIGSTIKITGGTHGGNFPAKFFRNQLTLVQLFLVGGWRKVSGPVEPKFVGVHFFFVFFDHHRRRFTQCLCQGRQPFVVFGGPRKQR
jgi:hypothetical protein